MALHSLVFTETDWESVNTHFALTTDERMAFGFCGSHVTSDEWCGLVKAVDLPADAVYRRQGRGFVSLGVRDAVQLALQARQQAAFLDAHSHPFTDLPMPSCIDQNGALQQARLLENLAPGVRLIRTIFGRERAVWAEIMVHDPESRWVPIDRIVVLGPARRQSILPVNANPSGRCSVRPHDVRSIEVLGANGMEELRGIKVAIIGLGGTGSAVARLLAGYIDHLFLIDPDAIRQHNAPRLHYYRAGDRGFKVTVARREILRAFPHSKVITLAEAFPTKRTLECLKGADFVFCCPDHNAVRYAVASEAARFMKPVIEVGCGGRRNQGRITALGYHVRLQVPGAACLACNGLDLRGLEDPASTKSRLRTGYLGEASDTVPGELMSLTTRAATDAVEVFVRYVTGYALPVPRHLYFDALSFRMIDATDAYRAQAGCSICGEGSTLPACGDKLPEDQRILACGGEDHDAR
jgi:molybdopterin/thiamine biosynthesis adenylyltransferase